MVAVISWETGQVLDVTVLSKSCNVCKETESAMGRELQEFLDWMDWMEKHQDSCNSNFTGSSPAMETEEFLGEFSGEEPAAVHYGHIRWECQVYLAAEQRVPLWR